MDVGDILKPESFYKIEHQHIFKAITELASEGKAYDMILVSARLKSMGVLDLVGGPYFISQLPEEATTFEVETHAKIIKEKSALRVLSGLMGAAYQDSFEASADPFEILSELHENLTHVESGLHGRAKVYSSKQLWKESLESDWNQITNPGVISGVPTKIRSIDKHMGGLQKTDLIILAARPAMGKTSLALQMAMNTALEGIPVLYFSLEMGKDQLYQKMKGMYFNMPPDKFMRGGLTREEVEHVEKDTRMRDMPLFLEDTASIDIATIKARIKWLVAREGIQVVYIDYLQLASGVGNSREQEISSISRGLKQAAKENNIPIVALSQLSRAVETRGGTKRPMLSDLRESGAIEQDADIVVFLYRPEYYGMETEDGIEAGATEFIVSKYRNGATGHIPLRFDKNTTGFTDYEAPGGLSTSMPKSTLFN